MSERKYVKTGVKIPDGKCMIDGQPIIAQMRLLPADGSVQEYVSGELKGKTIKNPDRTGDCPECFAHVPLSAKGFITSHVVKGGTAVPSSMLTEHMLEPTDTGSRMGDPRSAMQRRTVELDGAFESGTVEIPVPGKNGRTKLEEAPATEENVRAALEYRRTRKINRPKDGSSADAFDRWRSRCAAQSAHVLSLTRRLEAMRQAQVVVHAPVDAPVTTDVVTVAAPCESSMGAAHSPEGRKSAHGLSPLTGKPLTVAGASPGPALVKGRSAPTLAGEVTVRQADEPYVRPAPAEDTRTPGTPDTNVGPLGRDRADREIIGDAPKARRSKSQRSNYRRKQRRNAAKGQS